MSGKRRELHLIPYEGAWALRVDGELVARGMHPKAEAVKLAAKFAKGLGCASLKIHGVSGRVLEERSFGGDPHPPAG